MRLRRLAPGMPSSLGDARVSSIPIVCLDRPRPARYAVRFGGSTLHPYRRARMLRAFALSVCLTAPSRFSDRGNDDGITHQVARDHHGHTVIRIEFEGLATSHGFRQRCFRDSNLFLRLGELLGFEFTPGRLDAEMEFHGTLSMVDWSGLGESNPP
jgi:hypothetical protein